MSANRKVFTITIGLVVIAIGIGSSMFAGGSVEIRPVESSSVVSAFKNSVPTVFRLSESVDEVRWSTDSQALTMLTKSDSKQKKQRHLLSFSPSTGEQTALLSTWKEILGLATSPDGKTAFVGQWRTGPGEVCQVLMVDTSSGNEIGRLDGATLDGLGVAFTSDPLSIAVSPDGRLLAAGTKLVDNGVLKGGHIGGEVCLWRLADKSLLWSDRTTHTDIVESVAFSPDGKTLASVGDDKLLRLWDAETGKLRQTLVGAAWSGLSSVAWSPDGKFLATGGWGEEDGGCVRIWDVSTGKMRHRFYAFRSRSHVRVAFSTDGRLFATGFKKDSDRNQFRIHSWDASSGDHLGMVAEGEGATRAIAASPDGRRLAVGTFEGDLILLDLSNSQVSR